MSLQRSAIKEINDWALNLFVFSDDIYVKKNYDSKSTYLVKTLHRLISSKTEINFCLNNLFNGFARKVTAY